MKTTIDRQTDRRFSYDPFLTITRLDCQCLKTVGRYDRSPGKTAVLKTLHPARLTPAMFAKLNPGKVQPVCIRPQDDPDLRSRTP